MNYLFTFKYYKGNKKKFVPIIAILMLIVFMLCILQILSKSLSYSTYMSWVKPLESLSILTPTSENKIISQECIDKIEKQDFVERIIPLVYDGIYIKNNVGGNTDTMLFGVNQDDMELLIKSLDVNVKAGRLPASGTNEIALHWRVAANKDLHIGDNIGHQADSDERLEGEYRIVGILEGDPIVSFATPEGMMGSSDIDYNELKKYGICIIPQEKQLEKLNSFLAEVKEPETRIYTFETGTKSYHSSQDVLDLTLNLMSVILSLVLSLMLGLISYIFYYQRRSEFGILYALGFTGRMILQQIIAEISIMIVGGALLGIAASIVCALILNQCIFLPEGNPLNIWNIEYLKNVIYIPLSAVIFSLIPVWKMMKRLDPISIIEGEN